MTHKAYLTFIGRTQKTAKTECGRTVKTSDIAIDADCTCPGCIAAVDESFKGHEALLEHAKTLPGLNTDDLARTLEAARPGRYQTVYFL